MSPITPIGLTDRASGKSRSKAGAPQDDVFRFDQAAGLHQLRASRRAGSAGGAAGTWLSFVMEFLRPGVKGRKYEVWMDRLMPGGADWSPEIEAKIRACDIFVLACVPASRPARTISLTRKSRSFANASAITTASISIPCCSTGRRRLGLSRSTTRIFVRATPGRSRACRATTAVGLCPTPPTRSPTLRARSPRRNRDGRPRSAEPDSRICRSLVRLALRPSATWKSSEIAPIRWEPAQPAVLDIAGLPETGYERLFGRDAELAAPRPAPGATARPISSRSSPKEALASRLSSTNG